MRLFQPPMRFWTITAAVSLGAALAFAIVAYVCLAPSADARQIELLKIFTQALFVTLAGGVVLTFLNVRKEEEQRDLARDAAVREIVEKIRAVHRQVKIVKRHLRSRMAPAPAHRGARRDLPFRIPARVFEEAMDKLLTIQIEAEQVRDSVLARNDLLPQDRIDRVHRALDYAARYFHDVYQDFEDCVVKADETHYEITASCAGLADFLGRHPRPPEGADLDEFQTAFDVLKKDDAPLKDRYGALATLNALRKKTPERLRFRIVATECIGLASADLQRSVRRERWRRTPRRADPARAPAAAP